MRVLPRLYGIAAMMCLAPGLAPAADAFDAIRALEGDWEAQLAGFGRITSTVRAVSQGLAVAETTGTPGQNELSVYTRDGDRLLLTHYCAMTPLGHVVRMVADVPAGPVHELRFVLSSSVNLPDAAAPHMREVVLTIVDADHYSERWTKREADRDTVFELRYARARAAQ